VRLEQNIHRGEPRLIMAIILGLMILTCVSLGQAAEKETARSGGELVFAVGELPPSYDGHRETTFATVHPVAPHYSTLLRFDPQDYPKIVGRGRELECFERRTHLHFQDT
jgi:hypothetical protein